MARIAFALELGGELGHVRSCGGLGAALGLRGHRVAFLLSDLHSPDAIQMTPREVMRLPLGKTAVLPRPASYAEILVGCGYRSAETLAPLAEAWRAQIAEWRPDIVVADYAPTAMLAARVLGIKCINYGMGFSVPPRVSPLPSFRFDEPVDPQRVVAADAQALRSINAVLAAWGEKPLGTLSQLFECAEDFLCTFPELDQYGDRPPSGYWGPRFEISSGARHAWPARGGKRIFLYLKTALPQLDAVIDFLAASPHRVAAFIPRLDEARRARLSGPVRHVSLEPIRLEPLLDDCDLALTHGGQLTGGLASRGIPQLVFPLQFEQYITARRIEQLGCGRLIGPAATPRQVAGALTDLLTNPSHAAAARSFSRRYPAFSIAEQRRRMVARIEQLAREGPILAASPHQGIPQ